MAHTGGKNTRNNAGFPTTPSSRSQLDGRIPSQVPEACCDATFVRDWPDRLFFQPDVLAPSPECGSCTW